MNKTLLNLSSKFLLPSILIFGSATEAAEKIDFPANFGWCVATAAHQIEGGNSASDHFVWETSAINRVLSKDLVPNPDLDPTNGPVNSLSINDHACPAYDPNHDPDPDRIHSKLFISSLDQKEKFCEISGQSIDHWNRVSSDIALMKSLGVREYRMSVEWARIEPVQGQFDQSTLDHYADEIRQLKAAGIEPQVTLFHFTLPQWLREKGGWEDPDSPQYFKTFTEKVYAAFGPQVETWYTLNEPMIHVTAGYIAGVLPPGKFAPLKVPLVLANMLSAHTKAYYVIHEGAKLANAKARVGVAHHLRVFDPYTSNAKWNQAGRLFEEKVEQFGAKVADYVWNWMFFDAIETGRLFLNFPQMQAFAGRGGFQLPAFLNFHAVEIAGLKGTQDFLGLNYYSRDLIQFDASGLLKGKTGWMNLFKTTVNPEAIKRGDVNDMGWEIYPEGFHRILNALHERGLKFSKNPREILVSENGIADAKDLKREEFLKTHLRAMHQAMSEGVPVEGYCHWTLIDNFEWNSGYAPKFGLYSVDLQSQERTLRPSGAWYSSVIKKNGWED